MGSGNAERALVCPSRRPERGGALSTAGNLVFQVTPQGRLMAYTADKGEKLFEVTTGQVAGMGPPMTYLLDGKQYIALMGGMGAAPARGAVAPPFAPPPAEPPAPAAQQAQAPPPGPPLPAQGRPRLYVYTLDAAQR